MITDPRRLLEGGDATCPSQEFTKGDDPSQSQMLQMGCDAALTFDPAARQTVSWDDSIRDTKPILEDSIRGDLTKLSDAQLQAASQWSNSETCDPMDAIKRWVARGPINDELARRRALPEPKKELQVCE